MTTNQSSNKPIRVAIIGTRGIPNNYGGFERFVELLVDNYIWSDGAVHFEIYGENDNNQHNAWTTLKKTICTKSKHPFLYYATSTISAVKNCDIILSCGCGISFFSFLCIIKPKKLIVNPDGCEWKRTKWPPILRNVIHMMYYPALQAANKIILDAESLLEDMGTKYASKSKYIAYQAMEPQKTPLSEITKSNFKIQKPYILVLARLEPENNILMALKAFELLNIPEIECLIVAPTNTNHYKRDLHQYASNNVRFLGGIFDQSILNELRSNCIAYIHGHSVGGTNPSLLEALSTVSGSLFCHNNKYNKEVADNEAKYFSNEIELHKLLKAAFEHNATREPKRSHRYHPDEIAHKYKSVFIELSNPCQTK